ncbi:MAG: ABC transporter permease [Planctomycetota bacterium]
MTRYLDIIPGAHSWRRGQRLEGALLFVSAAALLFLAVWRWDRIDTAIRRISDVSVALPLGPERHGETLLATAALALALLVSFGFALVRFLGRGSLRPSSPWVRVRSERAVLLGVAILSTVLAAAILCPLIAPYDPVALGDIGSGRLLEPSFDHPLGTDRQSRDVFSRMLYGSRVTLIVSVFAVSIGVSVGTAYGAVAGFFGGWIDAVLMRIVDILLCFPIIVILLCIVGLREERSVWTLVIAMGLLSWPGVARLVRIEFLSLREREYVQAARALGATPWHIAWRHLLPNCAPIILVAASLRAGAMILLESGFSYLGLGVQRPYPSWGNIIFDSSSVAISHWWIPVSAGFAIASSVIAYNLLGDGLQDALDPRQEA